MCEDSLANTMLTMSQECHEAAKIMNLETVLKEVECSEQGGDGPA